MQSFAAAEQDCNSALKIDKRMTKAFFRQFFILWDLACPSWGSFISQARQSTHCPQQSNWSNPGFQESTATESHNFTKFHAFSCIIDFLCQVLSFDPSNTLAQAELAQLDGSAAKIEAPSAAAEKALSTATVPAKYSRSTASPPSSSISNCSVRSSSSALPRKDPPAKMTAFKPGFLNPEHLAPKPRRIQIKEDSDDSEPEVTVDHSSAAVTTQDSTSVSAYNLLPSMNASHAAASAAAPVVVTDEDIMERAARIATMNVTHSHAPIHFVLCS
jgi:hypothetical protein